VSELSERVLSITTDYIGPASRRFLERQTQYHLDGLKLDDITKKDLSELAKWIKISAGLLIDKDRAQELADKVTALSQIF